MRIRSFRRIIALCAAFIAAVSVLSGCTRQSISEAERTSFLFDTIITIKLRYDGEAEPILDEAFALCEHYNSLFDRHDHNSDIYRVNHSGGQPCIVSADTAGLILLGLEYARLSDGRYDITCGRVTGAWDFSSDAPAVPDADLLRAALNSVGWEKVVVDGCTVTLPTGTELDLGGIAKGFIADRLAEFLRQKGVQSAIINLGGNVYALGDKDGQPFKVGIQSPFGSGNLGHLSVSDRSVVTAGSYQRCFELNGTLYHHILDLSDGMPARSGLASVTVICESSAQADALATICFLMGAEDGLELIGSLDGVEAVFIAEDGSIRSTDGASPLLTLY